MWERYLGHGLMMLLVYVYPGEPRSDACEGLSVVEAGLRHRRPSDEGRWNIDRWSIKGRRILRFGRFDTMMMTSTPLIELMGGFVRGKT